MEPGMNAQLYTLRDVTRLPTGGRDEISADHTRLIENRDLTPYLRLQRPCDRMIAKCVTIGRGLPIRSPWWDSWVGGHAIQRCLLTGMIRDHFLVFEKTLQFN
jgi:hypothetical protein